MFWSQVIASAVAGTVQLGVMNWMFSNIPYVQTIIFPSPSMELNSILPLIDICVNLNRWNCTFLSLLLIRTSKFRSRENCDAYGYSWFRSGFTCASTQVRKALPFRSSWFVNSNLLVLRCLGIRNGIHCMGPDRTRSPILQRSTLLVRPL